ncbi:TadE/TadG family type IV pilus assembly protein [Roseinatronobacter sp. NSM]|uniref:TadE/TadG family type IV pilus assembly protein n=1 Tax=Roseinatronobacter sp. NSM TaxID=3457785 RepID=UPI0040357694
MICQSVLARMMRPITQFRAESRGSVSVEMVLVLPLLIFAYVASLVFFDAFRARRDAQVAALTVADLLSRNTAAVTTAYMDGLNEVYDFLISGDQETRLRMSSVMWDQIADEPQVMWSYGTRGFLSLDDFAAITADDDRAEDFAASRGLNVAVSNLARTQANGGGIGLSVAQQRINARLGTVDSGTPVYDDINPSLSGNHGRFDSVDLQAPVADLGDRIPPILPGEALLLVESFSMWQPLFTQILPATRLTPIAVTRPRFSPFINYEGNTTTFPEGLPETLPEVGEPEAPIEEEEEETPPEPETSVTIIDTAFTSGVPAGWSSTTLTQTTNPTLGNFLGPFGGETWTAPLTYGVNLGETSQSARFEFNLFIIDSWDGYDATWGLPEGEMFALTVNGQSIATEAFQAGPWGNMAATRRTVADRPEGRFTTTMTLLESTQNQWGSGWTDQIWRVVVDVENPATSFTMGFSANLDEAIDNESFGLLNFKLTAERGAHGSRFIPPASFALNTTNKFPRYSGCPDTRLSAKTHNLSVDNLWSPELRHRARAGGGQRLTSCSGFGGWFSPYSGYFDANPSFVINYDKQGTNWDGSRLRIETNDGNSGYSCNSALLARDSVGQWHFSDSISLLGLLNNNARLNMGHIPSGTIHVWVGRSASGQCNTDIQFSNY